VDTREVGISEIGTIEVGTSEVRYLEEVNPDGVKGALADLQERVTRLEESS